MSSSNGHDPDLNLNGQQNGRSQSTGKKAIKRTKKEDRPPTWKEVHGVAKRCGEAVPEQGIKECRRKRDGKLCRKHAYENGRCENHGGLHRIKHGLYSQARIDKRLHDKIQRYAEDPNPTGLRAELALLRGLLDEFLERNGQDLDAAETRTDENGVVIEDDKFERLLRGSDRLTYAIGNLASRLSRIESETSLTQAELMMKGAQFAQIVLKYVPKDQHAQVTEELRELSGAAGALRDRRLVPGDS